MTNENELTQAEKEILTERFAVIYAPKRQRERFPENCVQLVNTEEEALQLANPVQHYYAAKVIGPSRSSEGLKLYYLRHWLMV